MNALSSQLDYYRARAAEYDEWWLRRGRYDRGAALNAQWFAEAAEVQAALEGSVALCYPRPLFSSVG